MRQTFTIPGRLDGMNDLIAANRSSRYTGAQLKRDNQFNVVIAIRKAHLKPIGSRCRLMYTFFEPNMRRDMDNISGMAHKVIQDALVEAGILEGDGWRHISGYTDNFEIDRRNPRIEVTLIYTGAEE